MRSPPSWSHFELLLRTRACPRLNASPPALCGGQPPVPCLARELRHELETHFSLLTSRSEANSFDLDECGLPQADVQATCFPLCHAHATVHRKLSTQRGSNTQQIRSSTRDAQGVEIDARAHSMDNTPLMLSTQNSFLISNSMNQWRSSSWSQRPRELPKSICFLCAATGQREATVDTPVSQLSFGIRCDTPLALWIQV